VEFIHSKHRIAGTALEGAAMAVDAGLNVRTNFTMPETHGKLLREALRNGRLTMDTIDARVRDVLRVKYWLGLFDQPYVTDPDATEKIIRAPDAMAASTRAAQESIVLLKNENHTLPLARIFPASSSPARWRTIFARGGRVTARSGSTLSRRSPASARNSAQPPRCATRRAARSSMRNSPRATLSRSRCPTKPAPASPPLWPPRRTWT